MFFWRKKFHLWININLTIFLTCLVQVECVCLVWIIAKQEMNIQKHQFHLSQLQSYRFSLSLICPIKWMNMFVDCRAAFSPEKIINFCYLTLLSRESVSLIHLSCARQSRIFYDCRAHGIRDRDRMSPT